MVLILDGDSEHVAHTCHLIKVPWFLVSYSWSTVGLGHAVEGVSAIFGGFSLLDRGGRGGDFF